MSSFQIAIAVLSYNHPEITARAVESALRSSQNPVFLIHNGSEPKHIEILTQKFPNVKHLIQEKNKGYTGGVNFALKELFRNFEWIFLLTNDCNLTNFSFDPTQSPAFIAPLIYFRSEKRVDSMGGWFIPEKARIGHYKTEKEFLSSKQPYIPGTAFFIHRNVFEKVGPFDESLGTYWEDVDYSMRCLGALIPLKLELKTQIIHGVGKTCHKYSHYTTYLFQRNRKNISRKYTAWYLRPILECFLLANWIRMFLRMLRNKKLDSIQLLWKAILD